MIVVSYNNLRVARRLRGFKSLRKLAEASGISESHLSDIELDKVNPSVSVLCRLAKLLDCQPEDLFECKEVPDEPTRDSNGKAGR